MSFIMLEQNLTIMINVEGKTFNKVKHRVDHQA